MYRDVAQWTMVRQKVLDKGHSRRQVAKETGLSRNTIRKMLLHKLPQPYKPPTSRGLRDTRLCSSTQQRLMPLRL